MVIGADLSLTLGTTVGTGTGTLFASALWGSTQNSNTSIIAMIDADNNSTSEVWAVRANGVATNLVSVDESGTIYGQQLIQLSNTLSYIGTNTVDGTDNKAMFLNSAGGGHSPTRGGFVYVVGNEFASEGGDVTVVAGDSAISGNINLYVHPGGYVKAMVIDRATGSTTLGTTPFTGTQAFYAGDGTFSGALTVNGNATVGTDSSDTHIFRGAFSLAYSSGSTTRLSMTNTGLVMIGASTVPVAGIQIETGNAGSGTPTDYLLVKTSGAVASRGGLLISNQASVAGSANSLKITSTFNSSTSGTATIGWVDNNATETWVGSALPSMTLAYNAGSPFVRFNHPLQILAGQTITSSTANNFITPDNSGNMQLASRSSINNYIDYDNNTTATGLWNLIADNSTTIFSVREDGMFTVQYTSATSNVFTITGTSLTTGSSLRVYDNGADTSVRRVIFATNDNSLATGCIVAHLQQDSTANGLYIDHNANGIAINIDAENTTANTIDAQADVLTTGYIARFYSASGDASNRNLVGIINDNVSATGTTPFRIQQDALTSTNFQKIADFGGTVMWRSNGTTPNGALTGTAGDICLNGASNQAYYCTGTTNWTAM
jgi:hypothetical protein